MTDGNRSSSLIPVPQYKGSVSSWSTSLAQSYARADDLTDMEFDYDSPAELFIPKRGRRGRRQPINYRRFAAAAEAIRFAVEEFPAVRTLGAWMQVGDHRYDSDEICRLYESTEYSLRRAPS
jgi:hypothetical protein